jgi:hypothetical protein
LEGRKGLRESSPTTGDRNPPDQSDRARFVNTETAPGLGSDTGEGTIGRGMMRNLQQSVLFAQESGSGGAYRVSPEARQPRLSRDGI